MMAEQVSERVAMRWPILLAASGMMCGVFFIYDIPASLSTPLQEHLSLSDPQYAYLISALYTAYAVPNFALPCLSGFAVQRYGEKHILMLSFGMVVLGQLIFGTAVHGKGRSMLVFGRVLIGMGSEVPGVIASDIVTRCFRDHTLSLALAMLLCLSRLGSVATSIIIPRLVETYGVVTATWISTTMALTLSISCSTYLIIVGTTASDASNAAISHKDALRRLPRVFWLLAIICIMTYGCLGPFNNSAQRFLASRFYDGDQSAAGFAVSIPNTLSGLLVLPFGLLLDHPRFKSYPVSILFSGLLLLIAHLLFLFNIGGPILPLVFLGVGYAAFGVAFWPAVACSILSKAVYVPAVQEPLLESDNPLQSIFNSDLEDAPKQLEENSIVSEDVGGMETQEDLVVVGYGIMTSLLNLSMGIVPVLLAVMENLAGYSGLEMVFVALATISVFASARFVRI